jgi:hypothetical protein
LKNLGATLEARRGRANWSFIYDDTLDKTVRVKFLGQGYEKTAFLNEDEDTVYVITESEFPDFSLQDMSAICEDSLRKGLEPNPHLPCVIYVGEDDRLDTPIDIYKMPYYQRYSPVFGNSPLQAHQQYEALVDYNRSFYRSVGGHFLHPKTAESKLHPRLIQALDDMLAGHGFHYDLDVSPDNVGLDADGNIVLFDVFYMEQDGGYLPQELMELYYIPLSQKPTHLSSQEWLEKESP